MTSSPIRVAFVSEWDPTNPNIESGVGFHCYRAMSTRSDSDLHSVGPLRDPTRKMRNARSRLYRQFLGLTYMPSQQPYVARSYARQVEHKLGMIRPDAALGMSALSTAYLRGDWPVVLWSDSPFAGLVDYHPSFSRLCEASRRNGNRLWRLAADRATIVALASRWAREVAIEEYGLDPDKVRVIPRGVNFDSGLTRAAAAELVDARATGRCRLLLVGKNWEFKGVDLAVRVAERVNAAGLPCELHVVGCVPPPNRALPPWVHVHGWLPRSRDGGADRLADHYSQAHFLILPTRMDTFANVLLEANRFAVPSLARETAGVVDTVRQGVNGALFAPDAAAQDYSDFVISHMADRQKYVSLCLSAFDHTERHFRWDTTASALTGALRDAVTMCV